MKFAVSFIAARCQAAVLLGLAALFAGPVAAQAPAPGAGFADPQALQPRPPTPDIEPVYRPPSIDTLATVRRRGLLRVGVVSDAPMVMRDTRGELVGYSIDLARRLAEDMGVAVEFVPSTWQSVIPDLLDRHSDIVLSGLWITAPRALVVNFSTPTAVQGVYLVADRGKAGAFKTAADFNRPEVVLAVYAGTPQERLAQRLFPQAKLLRVDLDHLEPVLQGKAHAALVPTLAPQAVVRLAPQRLFLPLAQPLASTAAAIAVRKGDPDFLSFLDTWLTLQRDAGWLDERAAHWSVSAEWLQ